MPDGISQKPYLVRALYEWMVDSALTPYLLVDATGEAVQVPADYVEDGRIVLNVAPAAVHDLNLDNELVGFDGRFSGTPFAVHFPMSSLLAIYAKETGEGMMFEEDEAPPESPPPRGPGLKVVK